MPETNDFFAPLVHDASKVVFALPEDVRRSGSRRRASRAAAVAGLAAAVVIVIAVGSTWSHCETVCLSQPVGSTKKWAARLSP